MFNSHAHLPRSSDTPSHCITINLVVGGPELTRKNPMPPQWSQHQWDDQDDSIDPTGWHRFQNIIQYHNVAYKKQKHIYRYCHCSEWRWSQAFDQLGRSFRYWAGTWTGRAQDWFFNWFRFNFDSLRVTTSRWFPSHSHHSTAATQCCLHCQKRSETPTEASLLPSS